MARGDIVIRLIGDTRDLEGKFSTLSGKLTRVGSGLTKTLTPAAIAIGAGFRQAFNEFDTGADALRVGTGKTGAALKELEKSAKNVAGRVTQNFGEVGTVMTELSQRTNLTGKPLEQLTKKVLDLSRITGGDALTSVANLTRLFGDWSVKTEDQSDTMDRLFRLSQNSGIELNRLSELMVQFGSPLRQLGLDFETTAAMFARFEKEGVNIETSLPGLRQALKNFAKAGKEPGPALLDIIEKIKTSGSVAKANTLAFKTFGARAGADLAAAIREGRFELDGYIKAAREGPDTIDKAAKATLDWGDKFTMFKNKLVTVVGPIGEVGMAIAGLAAGIGPAMLAIGKIGPVFSVIGKAAMALFASPIALAIAAVVVAAILVWRHWDKVKAALVKIWGALKTAAMTVFNFLKNLFLTFTAVGLIIRHWDTIKNAFGKIWNGIKSTASSVFNFLKNLFLNFTPVGQIIKHWNTIKDGIGGAFRWIKDRANDFVGFFGGLPGRIAGAVRGMFDGIAAAFKSAVNSIIRGWNNLKFKIGGQKVFGLTLPSFTLDTPNIPYLAEGGIVNKPTLAMIGEKGPEAVIPLGHGQKGASRNFYQINVSVPTTADKGAIGREVVEAIRAFERRNGFGWRAA